MAKAAAETVSVYMRCLVRVRSGHEYESRGTRGSRVGRGCYIGVLWTLCRDLGMPGLGFSRYGLENHASDTIRAII